MSNKVLIVDDVEINREILAKILEKEYDVFQAGSGNAALDIMEEHHEDIVAILLDLIMPEMDGFAFMDELKKRGYMGKIPILIISVETSVEVETRCFEYGVSDFIHKPFDYGVVKRRVDNIVELFLYRWELETKVGKQTEMIRRQFELLQKQADKLQKSNVRIIEVLGTVVEERNLESGEHIKRVKGFTKILAKQMQEDYPEYGLNDDSVNMIALASVLHDVGKISIPDGILLKEGRLTSNEFEYMKTHTTRGCEILQHITGVWDDDFGKLCYDICRHHHERYNGKGYPDGLSGDEIPISAQLVSIADVYDALVSERVYKPAFSKEEAFHMIMNGECGVFSPKLLDCFQKAKGKFEELADSFN